MSTLPNTNKPPFEKWQKADTSADFIQLVDGSGKVLSWIDGFGVAGGSLANNIQYVSPSNSIQQAFSGLAGASGKILVPAGIWTSTASIVAGVNQVVLVEGVGDASIVQFTGATDGFNNCLLKDLQIQTTNASGGIAAKFSGLGQYAINVHISQSGSGLWAKGFQNFGAVTLTLIQPVFTTNTAATIGIDTVDNAGSQPGAFTIIGGEIRAVTTGIHLNNVLSGSMHGGSIEGCGTNGVLADTNGSEFAFYGTALEQNTTNDIAIQTSGDFRFDGLQFPGGTTNNFNCPNITCTARAIVVGCVGSSTNGNWIFGNTMGRSVLIGNKLRGAGLTVTSTQVAKYNNFDTDSTPISDSFIANSSGNCNFNLNPTGSGFQSIFQSSNTGSLQIVHNGTTIATIDGSGHITFGGTPILTVAAPSVAASQVGLGSTTATTVGAAGTASVLPANPVGYLIINVAGTAMKIPYYNN